MSIDQIGKCIERIIYIIKTEKEIISNKRLLVCGKSGRIMSGKIKLHFYRELVETAFNALINKNTHILYSLQIVR